MSDVTNIEWATYTGGPWLICTEVTKECAGCYARVLMKSRLEHLVRKAYRKAKLKDWKTRPVWGKTAPRVLTRGFWDEARRLNRKAAGAAEKPRMFPSLIDWLDDMPAGIIDQDGNWLNPIEVLRDFLNVVYETQNLDWLLLTKRPENWDPRMKEVFNFGGCHLANDWWASQKPQSNIWFMFSAGIQSALRERWEHAKDVPSPVHGISVEPMLERMDFRHVIYQASNRNINLWPIFGGESGPDSRECNIEWIRDGVRQFGQSGIRLFVKQLGSNSVNYLLRKHKFKDPKGGNMLEWADDIQIREYPRV